MTTSQCSLTTSQSVEEVATDFAHLFPTAGSPYVCVAYLPLVTHSRGRELSKPQSEASPRVRSRVCVDLTHLNQRQSSRSWLQLHLTFDQASEHLKDSPVGCFVVRRSQSSPNTYAIAVVQERTGSRTIWHGLIDTSTSGTYGGHPWHVASMIIAFQNLIETLLPLTARPCPQTHTQNTGNSMSHL
jgi:hypothetical protein